MVWSLSLAHSLSLSLNFALPESVSIVCKKKVRQGATGSKGRRCTMKEAKDIYKSLVAGAVRASPTSFAPQSVHCALVQILSCDGDLVAYLEGNSAHSSTLEVPRKVRPSSRSRQTGGDVHPPPQASPSSGIALRQEFCHSAPCIPTGSNSSRPAFLSLQEFPTLLLVFLVFPNQLSSCEPLCQALLLGNFQPRHMMLRSTRKESKGFR